MNITTLCETETAVSPTPTPLLTAADESHDAGAGRPLNINNAVGFHHS
jgi:hypothetical protein